MSTAYSRKAFGTVAELINVGHPLVALYVSLVRMELALKDHRPQLRSQGHRILIMLESVDVSAEKREALKNRLIALWTVSGDGQPKSVPENSYPHLRYLRHEQDHHGSQTVSDLQLNELLQVVKEVEQSLKDKGVAL